VKPRANHFAFAARLRGESCSAAVPAGRAPQVQGVAAVLNDGLRLAVSIRARNLGDGLKSQHAAAAEFAQSCERILESVDRTQGVEFIDEPQPPVTLAFCHGLEDGETQPC
jgi:hypothetical protein